MSAKILIKRKVSKEKGGEILSLIFKLRSLAMEQPGYVSGETLKSVANSDEYLVISTWESLDDWRAWKEDKSRIKLQESIDKITGEKTRYEEYYYPQRSTTNLSRYKGWERG